MIQLFIFWGLILAFIKSFYICWQDTLTGPDGGALQADLQGTLVPCKGPC